jgi:hypothetical protein
VKHCIDERKGFPAGPLPQLALKSFVPPTIPGTPSPPLAWPTHPEHKAGTSLRSSPSCPPLPNPAHIRGGLGQLIQPTLGSGPAQARPRLPPAPGPSLLLPQVSAPHSRALYSFHPKSLGKPTTHASTVPKVPCSPAPHSRISARHRAIMCRPLLPAPPHRT